MRGVVAAGDRRTAEAGRDVLADGGNAVDAAVAAAFTAFVAEPLLASAGGAGMMTVALPDSPPRVVDFFSTMPGLEGAPAAPDFRSVEVDFGSTTQTFHVGRGSVAPPAALEGLLEAARRFGRRPLAELVRPAARHAREGLTLSAQNAMVYGLLWPIQTQSPEALALASGVPPTEQTSLTNPALAELLEETAALGAPPSRFTEGLIEAFGPARGGLLSAQDLLRAAPRVVEPRVLRLGAWTVLTSPHAGGERVARLLTALAARRDPEDEVAEACAFAAASRLASARAAPPGHGSTTHVSVLDAEGGVAAVTLTNGEGCGFVVPGTGVQPNNFLGEEDLNPDGFHAHAPGVVLPTMIAPTVALDGGRPALALGSGGSNRIRSVVGAVLYRVVHGASLEGAIMAPRIHAEGDHVWLERAGWRDPDAVERALGERFARVHPFPDRAFYFGGVNAVRVEGDRAEAIADPRRGGAVAHVT
ncbi:MAG: gamma-glutamyltransferase [Sandaracinaceae bacterium]|nr:gamma-glutamyltransferase [Sandaracinaceae bacterium]